MHTWLAAPPPLASAGCGVTCAHVASYALHTAPRGIPALAPSCATARPAVDCGRALATTLLVVGDDDQVCIGEMQVKL